jgi:hypothetical protein
MRRALQALALGLVIGILTLCMGCSTINQYGVGGPPALMCGKGLAYVDDKLAGSDEVRLSLVRRFTDGDPLCAPPIPHKANSPG